MLAASTGMWAGALLLALMAVLWAALLRWARAPGWSVVGGMIAGLLLGPTVLEKALPATHEWLYFGGVEAREQLEQTQREHDRFRFALAQSSAADEVFAELEEKERAEIAPLREAHAQAHASDQQVMLGFTILAVSVLMLCTGLVGVQRGASMHSLAWPVHIGAWAAVLPGSLAAAVLWWSDESLPVCILAASALMIGPWALKDVDRKAADEVEVGGAWMIQNAGRVASVLAIVTWLSGLWLLRGVHDVMFGLPVALMLAGWIAPPLRGDLFKRMLEHTAVPIVAACAAVKVDFVADLALVPILLFLILSGDGRWLGALIGATALGGRRGLRSMRLVLGTMAAGPTQAAIAALGAQLGVLPKPLVLAALLGAALIEIATPARRKFAESLEKTEREIDELIEE